MNADMQHEPEHRMLLHQLRGSSTTVYMTLLSSRVIAAQDKLFHGFHARFESVRSGAYGSI